MYSGRISAREEIERATLFWAARSTILKVFLIIDSIGSLISRSEPTIFLYNSINCRVSKYFAPDQQSRTREILHLKHAETECSFGFYR